MPKGRKKQIQLSTDKCHEPKYKARDFCITVYDVNPPTFDVETMRYLCYQEELCPETKRHHYQGYVEFLGQTGTRRAGELLMVHSKWLRGREGTRNQARDYCRKMDGSTIPGTFREFGTWRDNPSDGKGGTNIAEIINRIQSENLHYDDVARIYPSAAITHGRGIKQWLYDCKIHKDWITPFWVLHGPSGCGKTTWIQRIIDKSKIYWKPKGKWWDGYDGQEYVVFDEWEEDKEFGYKQILELYDARPVLLQNKGGFVKFAAKLVIFCSTKHYTEVFKDIQRSCDPITGNDTTYREFERRVDFTKDTWEDCKEYIASLGVREKITPEWILQKNQQKNKSVEQNESEPQRLHEQTGNGRRLRDMDENGNRQHGANRDGNFSWTISTNSRTEGPDLALTDLFPQSFENWDNFFNDTSNNCNSNDYMNKL